MGQRAEGPDRLTGGTTHGGRRASFGLLSRSPAFTALLGARALSLIGDGVGNLALVVYVQEERGTGTAVGLLLLVASAPRLLSPLAGTVSDRVDRRLLLAAGELGQAVVLTIALVWLPPLPVLLVLLLGKATLVVIAEPAGQSAVPALVEDADLVAANSLLGGVRQAGEVLGPILGGAVVAAGGVRAGLAVDAATFLVSVPLLVRLKPMPVERAPSAGLYADARAGLRYTLTNPVCRALFIGFVLVGLTSADDVALPFLARALDAGPRGIGALYASVGAGLIVGYLLLARRRPVGPVRGLVLGAAVAAMGNGLTGAAPVLLAAVAFQVSRGIGIAYYETTLQTLLQRSVPEALLGRVFANVYGGVHVAACLGLVAGGALLDATSARVVLGACGGVGLLATAVSGLVVWGQQQHPG